MKLQISNDISSAAVKIYSDEIVNIAAAKLVQEDLLQRPCVRNTIVAAVVHHAKIDFCCKETVNKMKDHVGRLLKTNESLAQLQKLSFSAINGPTQDIKMVSFKIPPAYLPGQPFIDRNVEQTTPYISEFLNTALKEKEKDLRNYAEQFQMLSKRRLYSNNDVEIATTEVVETENITPPSAKRSKLDILPPLEPLRVLRKRVVTKCVSTNTDPENPLDKLIAEYTEENKENIPKNKTWSLFATSSEIRESHKKVKEIAVAEMKKFVKSGEIDVMLNALTCKNFNAKFFDDDSRSDCSLPEVLNLSDTGFGHENSCHSLHRCTFVMKCGSICLSTRHSYVQHSVYWHMTDFDVQMLLDMSAISSDEHTQIMKLHEKKETFRQKVMKHNYGFVNVASFAYMTKFKTFPRNPVTGKIDHSRSCVAKKHFSYNPEPSWDASEHFNLT
eukprot:Seg5464.4 transcript_id=Seg5464.4/GoldUCD/mRNA.D3Y31 product="hypothetical protein" protein_id=Seg5464.4/GoldUCD/D3Y31